MLKNAFTLSNRFFLPALKTGLKPIFLGAFLLEIPVQIFSFYMRTLESSGGGHASPETEMARIITTLSLGILGMIIFGYLMFVVPIITHNLYKENSNISLVEATLKLAWPMTIETLRAMGRVFLGICLFILPGLYFYLRYSQVPLIVLFYRPYLDKKVDALKMSDFLTRGYEIQLIAYMIASSVFVFGVETLKDSFPPNETPVVFAACFLLYLLVQVYFCIVGYFMYEVIMSKKQAEIQ